MDKENKERKKNKRRITGHSEEETDSMCKEEE
jgi:hypothetical protein